MSGLTSYLVSVVGMRHKQSIETSPALLKHPFFSPRHAFAVHLKPPTMLLKHSRP